MREHEVESGSVAHIWTTDVRQAAHAGKASHIDEANYARQLCDVSDARWPTLQRLSLNNSPNDLSTTTQHDP